MNRTKFKILILLLTILLSACISKSERKNRIDSYIDPTINYVPIEELISSKSKFHGSTIQTIGYFYERFEERAIYKNKLHTGDKDPNNAVWIYFSANSKKELNFDSLSNKLITIKGLVDTSKKGHVGAYACSLYGADVVISP